MNLAELTQSKSEEEMLGISGEALRDECADVLLYLLLIADKAGINLEEAARNKLKKNAAKYPIEKSYGSSRKYTQLDLRED